MCFPYYSLMCFTDASFFLVAWKRMDPHFPKLYVCIDSNAISLRSLSHCDTTVLEPRTVPYQPSSQDASVSLRSMSPDVLLSLSSLFACQRLAAVVRDFSLLTLSHKTQHRKYLYSKVFILYRNLTFIVQSNVLCRK